MAEPILPLLGSVPLRKGIADVKPKMAKVDRKRLAEDLSEGFKQRIGKAIERALEIAHMTKQDASDRMGYGQNQAPLSNWIAGRERPHLDKLFAIDGLRQPLVLALSEMAGGDVEVNIKLRIVR